MAFRLSKSNQISEFEKLAAFGCGLAILCSILNGLTEANFEDTEVTNAVVFMFAIVAAIRTRYQNYVKI